VVKRVDHDRVRAALDAAAHRTSAKIVVSVARFFWGSVDAAAHRAFVRLAVARTAEHNGVLVFVVPSRRRFVVLGDDAIHARVGQAFWDATVAAIGAHIAERDLTTGIVHGIETIAERLGTTFPAE
jgi:uncharacterized membrane protein